MYRDDGMYRGQDNVKVSVSVRVRGRGVLPPNGPVWDAVRATVWCLWGRSHSCAVVDCLCFPCGGGAFCLTGRFLVSLLPDFCPT